MPAGTNLSDLSITLGAISEAYQVYVNGVLVGATGDLSAAGAQIPRPRTFDLPQQASSSMLIAVRIRKFAGQQRGGWIIRDEGPYLVTNRFDAPRELGIAALDRQRKERSPRLVVAAVAIVLCILILFAWSSDWKRYELGWLAALLGKSATELLWQFKLTSADSHPWRAITNLDSLLLFQLPLALLGEFILAFLMVRPKLWLRILLWYPSAMFLLGFDSSTGARSSWQSLVPGLLLGRYFFGQLLVLILIFWPWKRDPRDHRPVHELYLVRFACACILINHLLATWSLPFPAPVHSYAVVGDMNWPRFATALVAFSVIILLVLLRRLAIDRQEKQRLASEIEAASVVQRLMLSTAEFVRKDLSITTAYYPALEVSGDFYRVQEAEDGGVLVVVGDVSGKGLRAAMTVGALVGALDASLERRPTEVLTILNRVTKKQIESGFVTCCACLISSSGDVAIANAGHLAPYLDSAELPVPSGVPLGVVKDADYDEMHFRLEPGSTLTFISDGVPEARNTTGELFGFDRSRSVIHECPEAIAAAARAFGQEDDISVLSITRKPQYATAEI